MPLKSSFAAIVAETETRATVLIIILMTSSNLWTAAHTSRSDFLSAELIKDAGETCHVDFATSVATNGSARISQGLWLTSYALDSETDYFDIKPVTDV
jgi:hypothetical protein